MSYCISNNRFYTQRALSLFLARNKHKRPKYTNKADVERGDCYFRPL